MAPIPGIVLLYGLLGIIPFVVPPLASLVVAEWRPLAGALVAAYGALILSFLGGARWGLAVARAEPPAGVVTAAMLPSLVGLALALLPEAWRVWQLLGLAAALIMVLVWDWRAAGLPGWYPRIRGLLTAGAVAGLSLQAAVAGNAL